MWPNRQAVQTLFGGSMHIRKPVSRFPRKAGLAVVLAARTEALAAIAAPAATSPPTTTWRPSRPERPAASPGPRLPGFLAQGQVGYSHPLCTTAASRSLVGGRR